MALVLKDRVKVTTTTTGTGAFAIGGAQFGFQGFSSFADGDTTYYTAVDNATGDWETGLGTYSTTGPSLARTQVLASSTGTAINFGAGPKDLFVVYPAGRAVLTDGAVLTGPLSVPAGASGAQVPQAQETYGPKNGQLAGMRNKIINGKMEIAQRGTSFAAASGYTLDRWYFNTHLGPAATVSRQSDVPSNNEFLYSLRATITTADTSIAAGDYGQLFQRIEGYNARDLIGRTFRLSFWVRSSKTGIHCVVFKNSGEDRSYVAEYTINAAGTWEYKTITVSGGLITAGTWDWTNGTGLDVRWILAAGSNFQTTAGAWQTGNFLATANQVNVLDTVDNIFAITGVQLEVGEVATPFEHRHYGTELALCQRYARLWGRGATGIWTSTTDVRISSPLGVTMRATPSATLLSTTPVAENWAQVAYTATGATITNNISSTTHGELEISGFSGPALTNPRQAAYLPSDVALLTAEL